MPDKEDIYLVSGGKMLLPLRVISVGVSAVGVSVATVTTPTGQGGPDFIGIAAIITSIVGAVGLIWSIWEARRHKETELDDALKIFREFEDQRRKEERGSEDKARKEKRNSEDQIRKQERGAEDDNHEK